MNSKRIDHCYNARNLLRKSDTMNSVHWILHQTSHNGNVGAAARAIKTMGFKELTLADPKDHFASQSEQAIALASGAEDILRSVKVVENLESACENHALVFGLTARQREFGPPELTLKQACELAKSFIAQNQSVAFLFGTERTGLANEDLQQCSHRVWIDANPAYSSLNLAQAVMVCAYEMRQTLLSDSGLLPTDQRNRIQAQKASIGSINAAMEHLRDGLEAIEFLDPKHPKKLMERLRSMFDRAELQTEEVDLLRGIAKQMLLMKQKK
jgi:tRNA/rRNA methyltransferase